MKLTVQRVMDVLPLVTQIINENRPMPQKGKYRFARIHAKLMPEFTTANEQRNAMIKAYDTHEMVLGPLGKEMVATPNYTVPLNKLDEFNAAWTELAKEEIDLDIQPVPFEQIDQGDDCNGSISAAEFVILGDLIAE